VEPANSSAAAALGQLANSTVGIRGSIVSDEKSLVTVVSVSVVELMTQ
jgi:hypothetical protein